MSASAKAKELVVELRTWAKHSRTRSDERRAEAFTEAADLIEAQAAELERVTAELDTKLWHWQKRALAAEAALSERTRALEKLTKALAAGCYMMSEPHLSGYRLIIGFDNMPAVHDAMQAFADALSAPNQGGQMMKLCDCERSHNGLGLAGRECDCPAIEDGWTDEQHQVAASYLTGPPSLASRVALLGQGACDCNTKSPDVHMHLPTCRYRQVMELADAVEELET